MGAFDGQDKVRDRPFRLPGCRADRVIGADPCIGVALPRRRKAEAAMQIPTIEEVGRLLGHADSTRVSTRKGFRAYVALCAFAGLRKGEAAGIRVGDVDFLRNTLKLSRQLQRDGSTYVVRLPKYGSERVVFLPEELVAMLSEHIATHLPDADPGAWLFTVGDGPMYDNDITWRWRATRNAAKSPTFGFTTCGTSTPPTSSPPVATSLLCSAPSVTRRQPRL